VAEKDILSSSNVNPGKVLPPAKAEMVKQFFVSDKISKIMPGTKDFFCLHRRQEKTTDIV
jgi:hypothetical protein